MHEDEITETEMLDYGYTDALTLLYRTNGRGDFETMTISRHDTARVIVCSFVGVVRELAVPTGGDAERIYDERVNEYVAAGWTVTDAAKLAFTPRTPEPWEIADPTSAPCPF